VRADAVQNRATILASARDLFSRRGTGVSMADVAEAAGVGIGTVYRRFPSREALIRAVVTDRLAHVSALVAAAEDTFDENPVGAWHGFLDGIIASGMALLLPAILPIARDPGILDNALVERRDATVHRAARLLERAQAAGLVRADVTVLDVFLLLVTASRPLPGLPEEFQQRLLARRLPLLLDSLTPRPDLTVLPDGAVQPQELMDVMRPAPDPLPVTPASRVSSRG
jgi:AcrR family transcriptional regulator